MNCVLILYVASHTLDKYLQTYTGICDVGQPLPLLLTSAMAFNSGTLCVACVGGIGNVQVQES